MNLPIFLVLRWYSTHFKNVYSLFYSRCDWLKWQYNSGINCVMQTQSSHYVHVTKSGQGNYSVPLPPPCSQLYIWSEKLPHLIWVPGSSSKVWTGNRENPIPAQLLAPITAFLKRTHQHKRKAWNQKIRGLIKINEGLFGRKTRYL